MSFTQNRFGALLGEEETEIDKLGNNKPIEKKGEPQPPTRREQRRTGQRQPAVSPPSRRDRGNRKDVTEASSATTTESSSNQNKPSTRADRPGRSEGGGGNGRRREFDRHSGTGVYDNEKKINKGWGEAGTAEYEGAHDVLDPNDPDAAETRKSRGVVEEPEENTKTLDEYLEEKKAAQNFRLQEQRKANEGSDDSQWKGTVPLQKEEGVFFVGKESEAKLRTKHKKEKVYLEYDQPPHRSEDNRRGGRGGRGGRGRGGGNQSSRGSSNRHRGGHQGSVNLSDAKAFPTLGA